MSNGKRAILALFVAGAGATAWFMLRPNPKIIFKQAQAALINSKSIRYETKFEMHGDIDNSVLKGSKTVSSGNISGIITTDANLSGFPTSSVSSFAITSVGAGGRAHHLAGESRKKDGIHYIKLADADALDGIDSGKFGAWYKSKRPMIQWVFLPNERDAALPQMKAEDFSALRASLSNADIVEFAGPMVNAKDQDGTEVWRFHLKLSTDVGTSLLLRLRELRTGARATSDDLIAATLTSQSWGEPEGDVLIDKGDKRIRLVTFSTTLSGGTASFLSGSVRFSNFNLPVSVEIPEARDLDSEVASEADIGLKPTSLRIVDTETSASSTVISATATVAFEGDEDGDGLSNSQENFYGTDPWNPDTDGDGFTDGQEVVHAQNPLGPGGLFDFGLFR